MTRKILIVFIAILTILLCSSTVFAEDNEFIGGAAGNIGSQVKDSWDKLGDSVQNVGNSMSAGMSNMGNDNRNSSNSGAMGTRANNGDNAGAYTATRTATTDNATFLGMNGTMWTWMIFGILAVALIALVWYYGMQQDDSDTKIND